MLRTSLLVFLFACGSPEPLAEPAPAEPAVVADDLGRVLSIARSCMTKRNAGIVLMDHESVSAAGKGLWQVRIRDAEEQVHSEVVDVNRGTCGDLDVSAEPGPVLGSLAELMDRAWDCGQQLGGTGVGDTPLVREGMVLHAKEGLQVNFSIPETEQRTAPTGMDLSAGVTCAGLVMD